MATPNMPPTRRRIRLPGFDYASPEVYFVTICTAGRSCLFGDVRDDVMLLNPLGSAVDAEWRALAMRFPHIHLDAHVVMPNHFHGLLGWDGEVRAMPISPPSLGTVIAGFKARATKEVNRVRRTPGAGLWQKGFYEHIVRNDRALDAIRAYILANPAAWPQDRENPRPRTAGRAEPAPTTSLNVRPGPGRGIR